MRSRWMEPRTGRFLSEDPIGLDGGINPVIFGDSDPVNRIDPRGTCSAYLEYFSTNLLTGVETITDRVCLFDDQGGGGGGPGRGLSACEIGVFKEDYPDIDLSKVRIIAGGVPPGYDAMTWGNSIRVAPNFSTISPTERFGLLAHELEHVVQFNRARIWTGFAVPYGASYVVGRIKLMSHNEAYRAIPAEVQARAAAGRVMSAKTQNQLAACH